MPPKMSDRSMLTNVNDFIRFLSAGGQLISSAMLKPLKICIKESRIFARAYTISKRSVLTETHWRILRSSWSRPLLHPPRLHAQLHELEARLTLRQRWRFLECPLGFPLPLASHPPCWAQQQERPLWRVEELCCYLMVSSSFSFYLCVLQQSKRTRHMSALL